MRSLKLVNTGSQKYGTKGVECMQKKIPEQVIAPEEPEWLSIVDNKISGDED